MKKESREKLVEKNIKWGQVYTDKTQFLKDQFEAVVGPGSYFRFEGAAPNGDRYYCIVGPAKVHQPKAKFFAGVRKLPATYSAGGKYFDSLDTAARYAKETWGVPTPKELKPYTARQLHGLSPKIEAWKSEREDNEEKKDDKEKKKDEKKNEKKNDHDDAESFSIVDLNKFAMGFKHKVNRTGWQSGTLEEILAGEHKFFKDLMDTNPSIRLTIETAREEVRIRHATYHKKYGLAQNQMKNIFQTTVSYSDQMGVQIEYTGAYLMPKVDRTTFYNRAKSLPLNASEDSPPFFRGEKGEPVGDDIIEAIMNRQNSPNINADQLRELKNKSVLYIMDRDNRFNEFVMPYNHPKLDALKKLKDQVLNYRQAAHFNEPSLTKEEKQEYGKAQRTLMALIIKTTRANTAPEQIEGMKQQIAEHRNYLDMFVKTLNPITASNLLINDLSNLNNALDSLGDGQTPVKNAKREALLQEINDTKTRIETFNSGFSEKDQLRMDIDKLFTGSPDDETINEIISKSRNLKSVHDEELSTSLRETGKPVAQPFTLDDFSMEFHYGTGDVARSTTAGKAFSPEYEGMGLLLPDNYDGGERLKVFSLSNTHGMKDMVAGRGSFLRMNRGGQNKMFLNILASVPEYHDELLATVKRHAEKNVLGYKFLSRDIAQQLTSMPKIIHFLTGVGQVDPHEAEAYTDSVSKATTGRSQDQLKFKDMSKSFQGAVPNRNDEQGNEYYKEFSRFIQSALKYVMKQHQDSAESPEEAQKVEDKMTQMKDFFEDLTYDAKKQSYPFTQVVSANRVQPSYNSGLQLTKEIANTMLANGIDPSTITPEQKDVVVAQMNKARTDDKKGASITRHNITPFLEEIQKAQKTTDEQGQEVNLPIDVVAKNIKEEADNVRLIYQTQHAGRDALAKRDKAGTMAFDLRMNPRTQQWITHGGHDSFKKAFNARVSQIQIQTRQDEADAVVIGDQELIVPHFVDTATRAHLGAYDEEGNQTTPAHLPAWAVAGSPSAITSADLNNITQGQSPEQHKAFYEGMTDIGDLLKDQMVAGNVIPAMFGIENMKRLINHEYETQKVEDRTNEEDRVVEPEVTDVKPEEGRVTETPDGGTVAETPDGGTETPDDDVTVIPPDAGEVITPDDDKPKPEDQQEFDFSGLFGVDSGSNSNDSQLIKIGGSPIISTLNSLIKISQELDNEGKTEESLEILRVAKKFSDRLKRG